MSLMQEWSVKLTNNNKAQLIDLIYNLPREKAHTLYTLLLHLSLPYINDPLKTEHTKKYIASSDNITSLIYFVESSPFWWHVREWGRFLVSTNKYIPNPEIHIHADFEKYFPRIATTDTSRIDIIMDQNKAESDTRVVMKIGRFLSKKTPAPEAIIPDISNKYANRNTTFELLQANTPAEIQWAFEKGPRSCMGKTQTEAQFLTRVHPVHAYATSDFSVFYVKDIESNSRIISRVIVSNINKTWVKIYGNVSCIKPLLHKAGFSKNADENLINHRLLNLEQTHKGHLKHIGPYIDTQQVGSIYTDTTDNKYLIINQQPAPEDKLLKIGETRTSYNNKGFIDLPPRVACAGCGEVYENSQIQHIHNLNQYVCATCIRIRYINVKIENDTHVLVLKTDPHIYKAHIVRYTQLIGDTITRSTEVIAYLNKSCVDSSSKLRPYKRNPELFIREERAVYVKKQAMFVDINEAVLLTYIQETLLPQDTIKINHKIYNKKHLNEHNEFKYNTISKISIKEIKNNPECFFYKLQNTNFINNKTATAKQVSRIQKPGFLSLNDLLIKFISNAGGLSIYTGYDTHAIIGDNITLRFIPDNINMIMDSTDITKFLQSSIATKILIPMPLFINTVTINKIKNNAIHKKKRKASTIEAAFFDLAYKQSPHFTQSINGTSATP